MILYSYRRPELTHEAIERILEWPSLSRLLVSIDGVRKNASASEIDWRLETIRIVESFAERDSRVSPCVWSSNDGLTEHAIRIMSKSFESEPGLIALEEDNLVGNLGLDFLSRSIHNRNGPCISTAFTSRSHLSDSFNARFTFFPEQWTTSLTYPVFERFLKTWKDKVVNRSVIRDALGPLFGSKRFFLEIVTEKWFRMFKQSVLDPSYGDALMAYSAISLSIPYRVPLNSLVVDIGHKDNRGLHPRLQTLDLAPHRFEKVRVRDFQFCLSCEKLDSGIRGTGTKQAMEFVGRKTSNFFVRGGGLQQK